jgi:hypothetical protein
LVAIGFHEELSKAEHSLARWGPLTALSFYALSLERRELIHRLKVMEEWMLTAKLDHTPKEPKGLTAAQEGLVRLRERLTERLLKFCKFLVRCGRFHLLQKMSGAVTEFGGELRKGNRQLP